ncbi:MAG: (d)CMP kinase [Clostridia bacterium]|nr:(d)CMP kinase [Clostridia bacterium]
MAFVVAIDGPAGCGKGTVTRILARKMNLVNIDTGSMYRCVTLECLNRGISYEDEEDIKEVLENINIRIEHSDGMQKIILNENDVSKEIRTPEIDNIVAKFAALKIVRDKITPMQQKMGNSQDIIMEGRDIGTVVFPNADVKIFLDCSVEERARRRHKQNLQKGINESYEEVLASIKERHRLETEREIAPFIKADDAILIDSTNMTIEEVVETIETIIVSKRNVSKD